MFYENSAQPIPVPGTRSYHDLPASGLTERIDWRSALGPVKVAAPLFALGSLPLIFRSEDDEY